MPPSFQGVLDLPDQRRVIVAMNSVDIAFWLLETAVEYLATSNLNGCTGVVVVSPQAGILAYIAPVPLGTTRESLARDPYTGLRNAQSLLLEVARLYQTHRAKFSSTQTFVVAGIFNNNPAMGDVVRLINSFFANLRLSVAWKDYRVLDASVSRPVGHSSIIIHAATRGRMPTVYLNSVPINQPG